MQKLETLRRRAADPRRRLHSQQANGPSRAPAPRISAQRAAGGVAAVRGEEDREIADGVFRAAELAGVCGHGEGVVEDFGGVDECGCQGDADDVVRVAHRGESSAGG